MGWNWIPFRNTKNWIAQQIEDCKNLPEVNSRMVFLMTSISIVICMLILTIGLFYSDRVKDVYEGGMAVLLGGHGVAAYGRSKTKGDPTPDNSGDSSPADSGNGSPGDKG